MDEQMIELLESIFSDTFFIGFLAGAMVAATVYLIRGVVALFQRIIKS